MAEKDVFFLTLFSQKDHKNRFVYARKATLVSNSFDGISLK